ncbi:hypothetical protein LTR70_001676 [Exophiala xenobiotica]|uniref:RING-type domain-containing protein n=1 Tax=Lithohypha guttulata TaxID=1690604 RepID=A0ABR0KIH8_9EURO|nr:hypothetical protein LTR24_002568 [Lithohypha guttulata]KAK5327201.1 hypothetical protein LTR70_001676 [Exophiala xenobiotica]
MSELWKIVQKLLLDGRRGRGKARQRCQEANPSQGRIASGMLPTEDELREFEASYAGPQSAELMERYSAWCTGAAERNKNCLVCLNSTRQEPKSLLCATCPRVMHLACLNTRVAHGGHKMHCPLCIKRRWHLIRPVTPGRREDQSADDFQMKRVRRYYRWHRYNCEHIDNWQKLHDDGSLDSDRKLLIDMGAAKVKTKQQPTSTSGNGAADGVEYGHGAHPSHSHGGEAAEYYNPDASRLETERASKTTHSLRGAHTAREGQRKLAPSASSSRPASSRQNSIRLVQPDNAAVSSTSKPNSRAPSSVRSSSTSSDVASKPESSVVKSALESGLTGLSKIASSAVSNSLVSGVADTNLSASKHSNAATSA